MPVQIYYFPKTQAPFFFLISSSFLKLRGKSLIVDATASPVVLGGVHSGTWFWTAATLPPKNRRQLPLLMPMALSNG